MADANRSLLFGLLALQNGLIDQGQLVAAFQAWTRDKARPLADHLVALGDLDAEQRAGVEALVARHLKKHGGDLEQSLAAISAGRSTRESLAGIGDADIEASLVPPWLQRRDCGGGRHGPQPRAMPPAGRRQTASGSASCAHMPRAASAPSSSPSTSELHREVALKQILDRATPTTRPAASGSCWRRRSPAGWSTRGSSRSTAWGPTATAGPTTPCGSSAATASRRPSSDFHADDVLKRDPGRRSLELRKLLRRFLDVCNAIEYAHGRGVLHRDIKPGNVIVGRHGETLVVDWGLAKAQGRADADSSDERPLVPSSASGSAETLPGSALGTPAYMSPEQARGDLEHLGPQSDVYSLGATLYFLLTGRPPVENDDVRRECCGPCSGANSRRLDSSTRRWTRRWRPSASRRWR